MEYLLAYIEGCLNALDVIEKENGINDWIRNRREVYQDLLKVIDNIY